MNLQVVRNQKDIKGFLGGHKDVKFSINAKLLLTAEEAQLAEHYKISGNKLNAELGALATNASVTPTLADLSRGVEFEVNNVAMILEVEDQLKGFCSRAKGYLDVARSFGGEQVWEI